ncbi:uncharacterized protein RJT20DRAFT_125335 [Scheffersomyces xylosifermentans]|uniref:uncharacterized protein n=1 Tax=Scheffersomyces xylosifermentans TaxID=1304137 RepID=UPI00315D512A
MSLRMPSPATAEVQRIGNHKIDTRVNPAISPVRSTEEITLEVHNSDIDSELESLQLEQSITLQSVAQTLDECTNIAQKNETVVGKRPTTMSSSSSLSSIFAPNWVYGTTLHASKSRGVSSSGTSGLCLTERGQITVPQPEVIQNMLFPATESLKEKIISYREKVREVLAQDINNTENFKSPLLVITGPTHIRNPNQAKACAQWIGTILGNKFNNVPQQSIPDSVKHLYQSEYHEVPTNLLMSMRTNLTKYNYDYNDPALLRDPASIMTFEIQHGIPVCRALLCELAEICPIVGETSDTITPQYLSDLFCLGLVSSTLIESQLHREMASGSSYAVGFNTSDSELPFDKSMYAHKVTSALDAMYASSQQHQFLSVTKVGTVAVVGTVGNEDTFVILQLNLQLDFNELKSVIEKVYSYSKLDRPSPRIMLDLGKVSNGQYHDKLSLLNSLLDDSACKYKIMGVIVDSGDYYVPDNFPIDLTQEMVENHELDDDEEDHRKLMELNKYFVQRRIQKSMAKKSVDVKLTTDDDYEYVLNADKLIKELEKLSKRRIEN